MSKADANHNEVSSILNDDTLEGIAAGLSVPMAKEAAKTLLANMEGNGFTLPNLPNAREAVLSSMESAFILLDYHPKADPTTPPA